MERLRKLVAAPSGPARPTVLLVASGGRPFMFRRRLAEDAASAQHYLYGYRQIPAVFRDDQRPTVVFPRPRLKRRAPWIKLAPSLFRSNALFLGDRNTHERSPCQPNACRASSSECFIASA